MADFYAYSGMPGPSAVSITSERNALLGPITWYLLKGIQVDSGASDAGNTPTTELRHGLLMAKVASTGRYQHYQPTVATGQQLVEGFLWEPRRTIDTDGTSVHRIGQLVIAGYVKASQLLLLDEQARVQMQGRFIFDDKLVQPGGAFRNTVAKTADYTVVSGTDNGTHFTTTGTGGAVNFTLPAIGAGIKGHRFRFTATENQNLTVTAPANKLVTFNNAAATSVAFSTAGQKIGGTFEIVADEAGTKWIALVLSPNAVTVA